MATPDVMMPGDIADGAQWPPNISYRDQWARWRVRKTLAKVYSLTPNEAVGALPAPIQNLLPDISSDEIPPREIPQLPEFEPDRSIPANMRVCIVGAGAAGLFTAMIFDWLKEKGAKKELPELNISYDIFEANGQDRLGGRLYTYKFPSTNGYVSGDHDYYDVGAMRFPDIPIMKRLVTHYADLSYLADYKLSPCQNFRLV